MRIDKPPNTNARTTLPKLLHLLVPVDGTTSARRRRPMQQPKRLLTTPMGTGSEATTTSQPCRKMKR